MTRGHMWCSRILNLTHSFSGEVPKMSGVPKKGGTIGWCTCGGGPKMDCPKWTQGLKPGFILNHRGWNEGHGGNKAQWNGGDVSSGSLFDVALHLVVPILNCHARAWCKQGNTSTAIEVWSQQTSYRSFRALLHIGVL